MFFEDWEKYSSGNDTISKSLLWDYNLDNFDWQAMRIKVVQRVIERGWESDYFAIFKKYGGVKKVKEIIKDIPVLSEKNINYVSVVFDLKKEELKCYRRKQLRRQLFHS